jgi:hypothetical protein
MDNDDFTREIVRRQRLTQVSLVIFCGFGILSLGLMVIDLAAMAILGVLHSL